MRARCAGVIASSAMGGRRHGAIAFGAFFLNVGALGGFFLVGIFLAGFFLAGISVLGWTGRSKFNNIHSISNGKGLLHHYRSPIVAYKVEMRKRLTWAE